MGVHVRQVEEVDFGVICPIGPMVSMSCWLYVVPSSVLSVYYDKICLKFASHHFLLYAVYNCPGPDLGGGQGGHGPRPPTIEGPPTKLLIFYFLLMNQLMTFL